MMPRMIWPTNAPLRKTSRQMPGIRRLRAVVSLFHLLREELANQAPFFLVRDAGEQLRAERLNRLRAVERQALVDRPAREMAGRASGLEERSNLRGEVYTRRRGRGGGWLCGLRRA